MEPRTTSIEESVLRSARSYLYGHPLAWELPVDRNRGARTRPATRRLPRLLTVLGRARHGAPVVAEAGGCG